MVRTFIILAVLLAATGVARADDAPGDIKPDAILAAIEKNGAHAFAEAEADIAYAQARLQSAQSGLMPSLKFSSGGEYYETTKKADRAEDNREVYSTLEVVQPIYDFGQTYGKIRSERARIAAAEGRALEARNTVLMEGLAVYYQLHASELMMRALFEAHASAYVSWERAKERHELGQASPIDVAEKLTGVEQTRLEYYNEQAHNGDLRARLTELTGLSFGEELLDMPLAPDEKPSELNLDVLLKVALADNQGLLVLNHELESLTHQRDGTRAMPSLDAYGNVNHYSRDMRGRDEWAIGARLSWPIFDGGLKNAERAQLAAKIGKLTARLDTKKRQLERQIRKLVIARINAFQRVVAARARLDYAERRLMQRQRQYEQERVTRLGFAMIDNTKAEAEMARATGEYFLSGARLAMVLGAGPGAALLPDFVKTLTDGKAIQNLEQFVPKEGSGYGQDDADKVNRKQPE